MCVLGVQTEFFALTKDGGWCLPYGKFFMEWYSKKLVQHGADVIDAVKPAIAAAVSSNGSRSTVRSLLSKFPLDFDGSCSMCPIIWRALDRAVICFAA